MSGPPRRIVVMDDSEENLETAVAVLEQAGYQVAPVRTLDELVAAVERPVDLVVMDVDMPDAEGDQLAVVLREIRRVEAPVLLHSGLDPAELAARAEVAEVAGHVSKSAGPDAMLARVRELLAGRP